MRIHLIGNSSLMWVNCLNSACVLSASIPSGGPEVVECRDRLSKLRFGPGFIYNSAKPPSVIHTDCSGMQLLSRQIYIGSSSGTNPLPSPWLNPMGLFEQSGSAGGHGLEITSFEAYAKLRADLKEWLSPLCGKTLVCDCALGSNCHVFLLPY